ncbi:hypothetical protein HN873_030276, partial [Arachis hypogaea]
MGNNLNNSKTSHDPLSPPFPSEKKRKKCDNNILTEALSSFSVSCHLAQPAKSTTELFHIQNPISSYRIPSCPYLRWLPVLQIPPTDQSTSVTRQILLYLQVLTNQDTKLQPSNKGGAVK